MAARTGIPDKVIENLRRFNRKERYYLIRTALDIPEFKLGKSFRESLQECLGLQVPEHAFAAMDYHLDWIYASLFLANKGMGVDEVVRRPFCNSEKKITATQQDIDLLIAYPGDSECHLLLLEAKGAGGFTNGQLDSKAKRLERIFGGNGRGWDGVIPHFALISPREPKQLKSSGWPEWMHKGEQIPWVELAWPDKLVRISRSDISGKPSATGGFWKVLQDSKTLAEIEDET